MPAFSFPVCFIQVEVSPPQVGGTAALVAIHASHSGHSRDAQLMDNQ